MDTPKTEQEIGAYKKTKSDFTDYTRFETDGFTRQTEMEVFMAGAEYTPDYIYPKLNFLIDDKDVLTKKSAVSEAVFELEAAKSQPDANIAELELFASSLEMRLKRILLVEAARNLCNPISMSSFETNRQSFAELNESLYGEFDTQSYLGMMASEKARVESFVPKSETASRLKTELEKLFGRIDVGEAREDALLDEVTLQRLHDFTINKFADALAVVPDTPDDVYYDVTQCAGIINRALEVGGLAQSGWKVVEDPKKSNPSTGKTKIYLPSNLRRNASELKRLIVHEQEVHARRAQNGIEAELEPLYRGTADYADVEEGLGVILECAVAGNFENESFNRARDRYITAGLALGADGHPRDAREVYETLWRILAVRKAEEGQISEEVMRVAKEKAYSHVENAYRGTQFWMKGVVYTKLKVYYEGLAKNATFFKANINNLEGAFEDTMMGKYNHTDLSEKELVVSAIKTQKAKPRTDGDGDSTSAE